MLKSRWAELTESTTGFVVSVVGCLTAWYGQVRLDDGASWFGWILLVLSAGCVALTVRPLPAWRPRAQACSLPRPVLLWLAVMLCVPAWIGFAGNQARGWALACWVAAMGLAMFACHVPVSGRSLWRNRVSDGSLLLTWPRVVLIAALCIGTLLRFYHLHDLPADLGWDLPYNYSDATRILNGEHLIFFPDNYGREGIFFYLIVAVSKMMGLSAYSIRVTSALVGVATIPAIYALGGSCFDDKVGAVAAMAMAINRWHLTLTRSGYRVSLMPLFCILALTALAWAIRRGKTTDWARTGLVCGLGLMTYKAFTFATATILALVVWYAAKCWWHARRSGAEGECHLGDKLVGPMLVIVLLGVAALPMIRVVVESPELYLAREMHGGDLVTASLAEQGISRAHLYASNLLTSVRMFNERGDGNPRFAEPFARHFGLASAVLMIIGLALAIRERLRAPYGLLCVGLAGLMAPMTVSMLWGEAPNCFRSSGVIGIGLVLASAALVALWQYWTDHAQKDESQVTEITIVMTTQASRHERVLRIAWGAMLAIAAWGAVLGLAIVEANETRHDYFVAFERAAPDIGNYSVSLAIAERIIAYDAGPAYVKVWPYWYDGRAVMEHLGGAGADWGGEFIELDPVQPPLVDHRGPLLILMHPDDHETFEAMRGYMSRSGYVIERYPDEMPALLALYGER